MIVTMYTDGSYMSGTGAGGWGCVSLSGRGRCETGGSFRTGISGANAAEFMAVANGLYCTLTSGVAEYGDKIVMYMDNMHVIGVLRDMEDRRLREDEVSARDRIRSMLLVNNLWTDIRHMKSHVRKDSKFYPQYRADKVARTYAAVADIEMQIGRR